MKVHIKLVPELPRRKFGEFSVLSENQCEILISEKENTDITEFANTLLHELLHLWVTVLQANGLKESIRLEHRFIDNVLPYVLRKLIKYMGTTHDRAHRN